MELIQQLAQGLNIQEEQAQGGAGLLFKMAQEKLGDNDFAQVANVVPGISGLIGAAPAAGGGGGLAGALGGGWRYGRWRRSYGQCSNYGCCGWWL